MQTYFIVNLNTLENNILICVILRRQLICLLPYACSDYYT